MSKPFDFDRAPRAFRLQLDPRTERIVRNLAEPELVGAIWGVAGVDAGMQGYSSVPHHRKGCDMGKAAESLLVAFAYHERKQGLIARQQAQDAALMRESFEWNAPLRAAAAELSKHLDGGE